MRLKDLLVYNNITIQCHDNPDADSLGSGFALLKYFEKNGKTVRFIYSGDYEVSKSNMKMLISECEIPIAYLHNDRQKFDGLLITVDCQYGSGNVSVMYADGYAVIDHHIIEDEEKIPELHEIRMYGSCCTLVYNMMLDEGFEFDDPKLMTALYYGLYQDTFQFSEVFGKQDKNMRDSLKYDKALFMKLKNANLSLGDLETAGVALIRNIHNSEKHYSIMQVNPCDPNLLGLLSDFLLQVDVVDCGIVFNELHDKYKLSVRSCVKEIRADKLAAFICEEFGSGGGKKDKAGGSISKRHYNELNKDHTFESYLLKKMDEFLHKED